MAVIPLRWTKIPRTTRSEYPFTQLQTEMGRLIDSFFGDTSSEANATEQFSKFNPRADLAETDKEYRVNLELPGIEDKDVEVSVEDNTLVVKGEKKFENEEENKNYFRSERAYGSFYRSIPFATEIDENKVEASFKNGILAIRLPKSANAIKGAKKVEIKKT